VRILTWNVARRSGRLAEQAAALASREPDVVALQEITERTLALWRAALPAVGLPHLRATRPAARRTAVLLAARRPLGDPAVALAVPRPETAVAGVADGVEVHGVHVPNAANGWVKVETLEAIRAGLAAAPPGPRVLCGDLNTPRREPGPDAVLSFARDSRGRLRAERGAAWDAAELGVVPGLRELGYRDAFRALHGYGAPEASWTWERIAGHGGGWRLDHLFASAELELLACRYHHAWREEDLSDHSALEADLAVAPGWGHGGRRREEA